MGTFLYTYKPCDTLLTSPVKSEDACGNMRNTILSSMTLYIIVAEIVFYAASLLMKKRKKSKMICMVECVVVIYSGWKHHKIFGMLGTFGHPYSKTMLNQ